MNASSLRLRLQKLAAVLQSPRLLRGLLEHRVLAGVEHQDILNARLQTIVDVGANRGQFALAARRWAPDANIIAFEPLAAPSLVFQRLFAADSRVSLHVAAIGPLDEQRTMNVSRRDDSSSLLSISRRQTTIFPGTEHARLEHVRVAPLATFIEVEQITRPALLKIDVQGFELDVLRGCESLLRAFEQIYCECSFIELYEGQHLAGEIIDWLRPHGFVLRSQHNAFRSAGQIVQADLLFVRS